MKCKKCLELMSLYIDRELSQSLLDALEQHLSLCEKCLAMFNTMEKTLYLSRTYYKKSCKVPKSISSQMFYHLRIIYRKK